MEFDFKKQPGFTRVKNRNSIEKVLISIITPFYNAGKYFEQTYNCVLNQTFIWFEWIIVDDGSTNKEDLRILENLAQKDERIRVYHIKNKGPAAARNYAVSKTTTDLIVSLDADDLIETVYLEQTYFALFFHPEADWAYTDSLGFGEMEYVWKVPFDGEKLKKRNFLIEIGTFRKSAFQRAGGYDDAQKHSHEDWNLWLRFMVNEGFPIHISSLSSWYRIVSDGALHKTNDNKEAKKRAFQRIKETAEKIRKPMDAIEYPRIKNLPFKIETIDLGVKKAKENEEVLILVSNMEQSADNYLSQKLVEQLNKRNIHVGIMATEVSENMGKYRVHDEINDIYELPTFLDPQDFLKFISYYIISRQVDTVFISGSQYARYLVPWLRIEFNELKIINCAGESELFPESLSCWFDFSLDITEKNVIEGLKELEKVRPQQFITEESVLCRVVEVANEYLVSYYQQLYQKWRIRELEERLDWKNYIKKSIKAWIRKQQY